jgi:hypothetical protein
VQQILDLALTPDILNEISVAAAVFHLGKRCSRDSSAKRLVQRSPLLAKLLGTLPRFASSLNGRSLANIWNALPKLGVQDSSLEALLCEMSLPKASNFNAQNIANTLWALGKLDVRHEALVARLGDEAVSKARNFDPQNIANTLWALAKLDVRHEALVARLSDEAVSKARNFNPQNIANTLWALVCLECWDAKTLILSLVLALKSVETDVDAFVKEQLTQLYQVRLALSTFKPKWEVVWPPRLSARMKHAWDEAKLCSASSRLHLNVSRTLSALGHEHKNESHDDHFSLDIRLLDSKHGKAAIEVDGPSLFAAQVIQGNGSTGSSGSGLPQPLHELGHSRLKARLLRGLGWKLVKIPFTEWDALRGDRAAQERYLRTKCKAEGISLREE